jgi:hypothetical protein
MPREHDSINGVQVFSWAPHWTRTGLGEQVTQWLRTHTHVRLVDVQIRQSSNASSHLISIVLFYREPQR